MKTGGKSIKNSAGAAGDVFQSLGANLLACHDLTSGHFNAIVMGIGNTASNTRWQPGRLVPVYGTGR